MRVDINDPNSVLWLQQALPRVIPWRVNIDPTGQYDGPTQKAVFIYQRANGLPQTHQPDAETIAKIEQDLAVLDAQPFKMKRP